MATTPKSPVSPYGAGGPKASGSRRKSRPSGLSLGNSAELDSRPDSPACLQPLREHLSTEDIAERDRDRFEEFLANKKTIHADTAGLADGNFTKLKTLQSGEGRSVHLVKHESSDLVLVQKVIHRDGQADVMTSIMNEIDLMHKFNSPFIVNFYGAFVSNDHEVNILMEHMNCGCLCNTIKHVGRIDNEVMLGKVAEATILGLKYVWDTHKVLHRDIKPSNILVDRNGGIKLCDFGVSKSLGSMDLALTFVGTMMYLSPERIQGKSYNTSADLWSLGLTLLEIATGNKPVPVLDTPKPLVAVRSPNDAKPREEKEARMAPFTIIQGLLDGPPPSLPQGPGYPFTAEFADFCKLMLMKDQAMRPSFEDSLKHPWIARVAAVPIAEVAAFFSGTMPEMVSGVGGGGMDAVSLAQGIYDAEHRRSSSSSSKSSRTVTTRSAIPVARDASDPTLTPVGSPRAVGGKSPSAMRKPANMTKLTDAMSKSGQ